MPEGPGRRVLVIDDNPDNADSLAVFLRLFGHEVTTAYTGPHGLALALEQRPDAVVCDVGLPGLSGLGVAAALRQSAAMAGGYLLAVTGHSSEIVRRECLAAGFDHAFFKPADPYLLAELLAGVPRAAEA